MLLAALLALSSLHGHAPAHGGAAARERWAFHLDEQAVQRLWLELSARHAAPPGELVFEHVTVLPLATPEALADHTVWIRAGRIHEVAPAAASTAPPGVARIDARGKYLLPGLVDMHVHTSESSRAYLLDLAAGVTGVRELCGFPWMLRRRAQARAGKLLAPHLSVSGPILNAAPMGMYATVVSSPEEARARVREQVAAGYDFVKVHNSMPLAGYRAIAEEARRLGVRMLGHVPSGISLAEALAQGHHTQEHLKGVILDATLELTDEDWFEVLDGTRAFLCPTLYTGRSGLVGQEALALIDGAEEMRYVPAREREAWRRLAATKPAANSFARVSAQSREVFPILLETDVRWLAGTDSGGGYEHMVRGFALHEELRRMRALGLAPLEVLRAATVNAAEALDAAAEFGTVERGKRADLLLLAADPRADLGALTRPEGVMLAGHWLARAELDALLAALAELCARPDPPVPDAARRAAFLAEMEAQAALGMVFMDHHLEELAELFEDAGEGEAAASFRARKGS